MWIRLQSDNTPRTITVSKKGNLDLEGKLEIETINYKIGNESFVIPIIPKELRYPRQISLRDQRQRIHHRLPPELGIIDDLKNRLQELINVSWLSVHRDILEERAEDVYHEKSRRERNPVDRRLGNLMERFTTYQLYLVKEASKLSNEFEKEVLRSNLYNKELDTFETKHLKDIDLEKMKKDLIAAYKELKVFDIPTQKRIEEHFEVASKAIKKIYSSVKKEPRISIEDFFPFPLLNRTDYIIKLSRELEKEKEERFKPIDKFLDIANEFVSAKSISLEEGGKLKVELKKNDELLSIKELSSGEKQLLIFLTETLLQKNKPFIFIADEPELSLHIEWQEKIISSIQRLNKNSQIIFATHSPAIAAGYRDKLIGMEDIIYGQPELLSEGD